MSADQALREPSWRQAYQAAFAAPEPLVPHTLTLDEAIGHTLAEDMRALTDVSHYASSAMDGWAVAGGPPWELIEDANVVQRVGLESGEAAPVLTGGLIPDGAAGVLRTEHGQPGAGGEPSRLERNTQARPDEPRSGEHIRSAGEEAAEGEVVLPAGTVLNPAQIALAAICGHDTLLVLRAPRVTLLRTGDEVIDAGLPEPGQVRDTFGPVLPTFVAQLGGEVTTNRHIADRLEDLRAALAGEALDPADIVEASADVVITTGGTGSSSADHLRTALDDLGAERLIDGIAMRPGHPALLGRLADGRFVVALPGNPLAALMVMLTLVKPLLAGLRGAPMPELGAVASGVDIDALPGRDRLLPYDLVDGAAVPSRWVRPGMLRGLATADGVLVVPAQGAAVGQVVPALELPW